MSEEVLKKAGEIKFSLSFGKGIKEWFLKNFKNVFIGEKIADQKTN
jgi:hypothetical protein